MNTPSTIFLTAGERAIIAADVVALIDDAQLSIAVSYGVYAGRSLNPATGAVTESRPVTSVRAIRNLLTAREIAAGAGLYQAGDVRFMLKAADLAARPKREDRLTSTADALTYEPVTWNLDPLGLIWNVVAREVKR
jgi:hypothetical protein